MQRTTKLTDFDARTNGKDGFVYYVDPSNQQCPICGMIGSLMKGLCQNCGCFCILDKKLAGKKEPLEDARKRMENMQKSKPKKLKSQDENDLSLVDEDDDIVFKEARTMSQEQMAIEFLKKIKSTMKDTSSLLGQYFQDVTITFEPFKMEVSKKPRKMEL